jgi:2-methylcitrate dehydratase PrpD
MEPVLTALARLVAVTPEGALADGVSEHATLVLADTVGAILGGSHEAEIRRLHGGADRAVGPATVLGAGFPRVEPWWAIVANGLAGTMLELDEGNRFARGHPGIHVLPAALAEAERLGRSGAALVAALVVGYDVAARLGGGAPVRPGMHMHGVHGAVGAAAAVARLRELDAEVTARALGVAAGLTLGTSWRTALGGATVRNAYAGVAGANGWPRRRSGRRGYHAAPRHARRDLRPDQRHRVEFGRDPDRLGERFEISRNYFKRQACCRYNHPAVEAIEELLRRDARDPGGDPSDPRRGVGPRGHDERPGPDGLAGREVLDPVHARGPARPWELGRLRRQRLPGARAVGRAHSRPRPAGGGGRGPGAHRHDPRRPAGARRVRLRDGRVLARQVDQPLGEFDRPYPESLLREKFIALAGPDLEGPAARSAWELCRRAGELKSARDLTDGLRTLATSRHLD